MALHVRHRTPYDVILMPECAYLQLRAVVAYCSLVYFRFSYALFCFACFVVVPCVLQMRPNKPHCYNNCDLHIETQRFSFTKMHLKGSSVKYWPFCLGLYVSSVHEMFMMSLMDLYQVQESYFNQNFANYRVTRCV